MEHDFLENCEFVTVVGKDPYDGFGYFDSTPFNIIEQDDNRLDFNMQRAIVAQKEESFHSHLRKIKEIINEKCADLCVIDSGGEFLCDGNDGLFKLNEKLHGLGLDVVNDDLHIMLQQDFYDNLEKTSSKYKTNESGTAKLIKMGIKLSGFNITTGDISIAGDFKAIKVLNKEIDKNYVKWNKQIVNWETVTDSKTGLIYHPIDYVIEGQTIKCAGKTYKAEKCHLVKCAYKVEIDKTKLVRII